MGMAQRTGRRSKREVGERSPAAKTVSVSIRMPTHLHALVAERVENGRAKGKVMSINQLVVDVLEKHLCGR